MVPRWSPFKNRPVTAPVRSLSMRIEDESQRQVAAHAAGVRKLHEQAATQQSLVRQYDSAQITRLNGDWCDSRLSSEREIRDALEVLRSNSREAERNNGLYRRMLQMHEVGVIGRGFRLRSLPRDADLKLDQIAASVIERMWQRFANRPVTLNGRQNLVQLIRLAVRTWMRDGECFIRLHVRGGELRLQILESDYVPVRYDQLMTAAREIGGTQTRAGIIFDGDARPVGYHIALEHPGRYSGSRESSLPTEVVPASKIIHLFQEERPEQIRGIPMGCASFDDARMLKGYATAELAAARANAVRPIIIESDPNPHEQYKGDGEDADGQMQVDMGSAGITVLPPGHRAHMAEVNHPSGAHAAFVAAVCQRLAAQWGVSYVMLTRNLEGSSWATLKAESVDIAQYFAQLQDALVAQLLTKVFERWIDIELLRPEGLTSGRVVLRAAQADKYKECQWIRPPKPISDWVKEVAGGREAIKLGIRTLEDVCEELTGDDLDTVLERRESERAELAARGLTDVLDQDGAGQEALLAEQFTPFGTQAIADDAALPIGKLDPEGRKPKS